VTRQVSLGVKLEQLAALRDSGDLDDDEADLVDMLHARYRLGGDRTSVLSDQQVEMIETLWQRNNG
jgi:replicative DNA helicase